MIIRGRRSLVALGLAVTLALTGCAAQTARSPAGPPPQPGSAAPAAGTEPQPEPAGEPEGEAWVEATLAAMTPAEKAGQLLVLVGYGSQANTADPWAQEQNLALLGVPTLAEAIAALHPGGIVYFGWAGNTGANDPATVAALSAGLQGAARNSGAGVPLLLAIDQEGGGVARLGPPFTVFPAAMAVAATGDPALARAAAAATAAELRAAGLNWNFAPVADVNVNPLNPVIGLRSFGSDPVAVASFVTAQVAGFHEGGVAATVKHFPGHGDTAEDSHLGLPVVPGSADELAAGALVPFREAVRLGVDAVMIGHLAVPGLDPAGWPATFSPAVVTGLLREELQFDGVVVTDALDMAGAARPAGAAHPAVAALQAGADLLLMPPAPAGAVAAIVAAVEDGVVSSERLDASVRRVLRLKWRRGLAPAAAGNPLPDPGGAAVVGAPAHQALSERISRSAVTLVRNRGVLPAAGPFLVAGPDDDAVAVAAALNAAGVAAQVAAAGSLDDQVSAARQLLALAGSEFAAAAAAAARAKGLAVTAVSLDTPYALMQHAEADALVAVFGREPAALATLADVLAGHMSPAGRLPVSLAGPTGEVAYPAGHGLGYNEEHE